MGLSVTVLVTSPLLSMGNDDRKDSCRIYEDLAHKNPHLLAKSIFLDRKNVHKFFAFRNIGSGFFFPGITSASGQIEGNAARSIISSGGFWYLTVPDGQCLSYSKSVHNFGVSFNISMSKLYGD